MVDKHNVDVVLLQETWSPKNPSLNDFQRPLLLPRGDGFGGVGIWVRKNVKVVEHKNLQVSGLEAIWAEVMLKNVRCLVGSIYININKLEDIVKLGNVIDRISAKFKSFIICLAANSRSMLWEDGLESSSFRGTSFKMGKALEELILK